MEEPAIGAGGDIVEVHVCAHEGSDAGVGCRFERRQVDVPHLFFGNVGGVVVAATVGGAVSGKVFGAGHDVVGQVRLCSLETENLRAGHRRAKVWIFAGAFDHASPARVAGDVDHGAKGPGNADCAGFAGGDGLCGFDHLWIPGRRHRNRRRKDRVIAVDDIEAEEDWNVQAGFVDGDVLPAVDFFGVGDPEHRPGTVFAHHVLRVTYLLLEF